MEIINLKLSATMCYLIPVQNKYLLVDTGYEKDKELFYKRLSESGITIKDIAYVLLTHYHDDHSGLVKEIKSMNPSCKIIMHTKAIPFLERGKNDVTNCKYINWKVARIVEMFRKLNKEWDFTFPPYKPHSNDIIIKEETVLNKIGINIPGKIIYTPGHTDDSITLLLDNGLCFVGDAAANMMQLMGAKYCVILIRDLKQYYKSWESIIEKNAKMIYPGHGKSFSVEKLKKNLYKNKSEQMVLSKS
jgi:glyoxylase-like metal-dependent hydrolase (beta-lactamase superfamily II)